MTGRVPLYGASVGDAIDQVGSMPLEAALSSLEQEASSRRPEPQAVSWAGRLLGVPTADLARWYARAGWGKAAGRVVQRAFAAGRPEQVTALLDDDPWPRTGNMLVGAHLGPHRVAAYAAQRRYPGILMLTTRTQLLGSEQLVPADTSSGRARFLGTAALRLREGLQVYATADGRWGSGGINRTFLGMPVRIRLGVPRLLRVIGSESTVLAAVWRGHRIGLSRRSLPTSTDPEDLSWEKRWIDAYLGWMEDICHDDPANLRLAGGFWMPGT